MEEKNTVVPVKERAIHKSKSKKARLHFVLGMVNTEGRITTNQICERFAKECVGNCVASATSVKPYVTRLLGGMVTAKWLVRTGGRGKATFYEKGPRFPQSHLQDKGVQEHAPVKP